MQADPHEIATRGLNAVGLREVDFCNTTPGFIGRTVDQHVHPSQQKDNQHWL
jgi:hypothetical protein